MAADGGARSGCSGGLKRAGRGGGQGWRGKVETTCICVHRCYLHRWICWDGSALDPSAAEVLQGQRRVFWVAEFIPSSSRYRSVFFLTAISLSPFSSSSLLCSSPLFDFSISLRFLPVPCDSNGRPVPSGVVSRLDSNFSSKGTSLAAAFGCAADGSSDIAGSGSFQQILIPPEAMLISAMAALGSKVAPTFSCNPCASLDFHVSIELDVQFGRFSVGGAVEVGTIDASGSLLTGRKENGVFLADEQNGCLYKFRNDPLEPPQVSNESDSSSSTRNPLMLF